MLELEYDSTRARWALDRFAEINFNCRVDDALWAATLIADTPEIVYPMYDRLGHGEHPLRALMLAFAAGAIVGALYARYDELRSERPGSQEQPAKIELRPALLRDIEEILRRSGFDVG